jgi:hypothetical protein
MIRCCAPAGTVLFPSGCLGTAYYIKVFSDSGIQPKANRESKEHSGVQA